MLEEHRLQSLGSPSPSTVDIARFPFPVSIDNLHRSLMNRMPYEYHAKYHPTSMMRIYHYPASLYHLVPSETRPVGLIALLRYLVPLPARY